MREEIVKMNKGPEPLTFVDVLWAQAKLQALTGHPMGYGEAAVKENILAMINELMEVLDEVNWKPWKTKVKVIDRDLLLMEMTDVLQFWANMVNAMGFTAQDVKLALTAKWQVNLDRVDEREVTRG